jgi:hypothetical protein
LLKSENLMPLNVRDRLGLGFGHSGGEALGVLGDDFAVFLGLWRRNPLTA